MTSDERPSKRDAFVAFLRDGWVSLHLDARRPGVVVPPDFRHEPHLVLQYGRNMPIPIPDLEITDQGVTATLSFKRTPHRTEVPWSAVYVVACTDGHGVLYYEDVPQEVALMPPPTDSATSRTLSRHAPEPAAPEAAPEPRSSTTRRLRSVPAEAGEEAAAGDEPDSDSGAGPAPKRRRKPQLRLVK